VPIPKAQHSKRYSTKYIEDTGTRKTAKGKEDQSPIQSHEARNFKFGVLIDADKY